MMTITQLRKGLQWFKSVPSDRTAVLSLAEYTRSQQHHLLLRHDFASLSVRFCAPARINWKLAC